MHYKYVTEKLNEAEQEAASPTAEWLDYKNVFRTMREKYRDHGKQDIPTKLK